MFVNERIRQQWFFQSEPVYEHPYTCVADLAVWRDTIVVPDGEQVTLLGLDGTVAWQGALPRGSWGSPVVRPDGSVVLAALDDALSVIDLGRREITRFAIPATASTDILVSPTGGMFLGLGSNECSVVGLAPDGSLSFTRALGRDGALWNALARASDGSLWVPTDAGLYRLSPENGEILARTPPEPPWVCISNPLPRDRDALVVRVCRDGATELILVAPDGSIIRRQPLPPLLRARLVAGERQRVWLAGSTVDWQAPLSPNDRVIAMAIEPDGTLSSPLESEPQTAVSASMDPRGRLWVGTYTYDLAGERGELLGFVEPERRWLRWSLEEPRSGFGAPLFLSPRFGVVATSNGVAAFEIETIR